MRRRLYEAIRQLEPKILEPFDIVITVFQDDLLAEPPKQLTDQLVRQLREAEPISDQARPDLRVPGGAQVDHRISDQQCLGCRSAAALH